MASSLAAGLHLVATPIGNLSDVSLRALQTLADVDLIACEDTRLSSRLLTHYGIKTKCVSYHDRNAVRQRPRLLRMLASGARIALISDAGTPLVSDPGYKLVGEVLSAGIGLHVVPGASAPLAALLLSGLPSDRFFFEGFLPVKSAARCDRIAALRYVPGTLLFFESPRRLSTTLRDLANGLGNRCAVVAREMTKLHEEVRRGALDELATVYNDVRVRGEIVIVVAPPDTDRISCPGEVEALLDRLLPTSSLKDAVREAADLTGLPRRDIYECALKLRSRHEAEDGGR